MKKITLQLVVASIFLGGSLAKASGIPVFSDNITTARFNADEPIAFTERGIGFYVFANGEFDFNTRPQDSDGGYYYKTSGNRVQNEENRRPRNYGVRIEYDAYGRVRRVGNTFINYDYNDRVSRIGSVFIGYNRFALSQVGGLQIIYNRRGQIIDIYGSVKGNNSYCNSYQYRNYDQGYQIQNNDYEENNNQDDYYYYKADGTKAKIKKEEIENTEKKDRR